jgi:predicted NUDIX family phosphoesterase
MTTEARNRIIWVKPVVPAKKEVKEVLCVPARVVDNLMAEFGHEDRLYRPGRYIGVTDDDMDYPADDCYDDILRGAELRPKDEAEHDAAWKQVVPYAVFTTKHAAFVYTRGKAGDEGRLHDLLSVGVGGHVEPEDLGHRGVNRRGIEAAMMREIAEEIRVLSVPSWFRMQGVVDHPEGVGLYHVGLVYECRLAYPDLDVRESGALADGKFVAHDATLFDRGDFEPWSRLALDWSLD